MNRYINNKEQHNKVLFELGLLDDDDDWNLFCKMKKHDDDIDHETYAKYVNGVPSEFRDI